MKFIRVDGNIYDVEHKETIERLEADENFEKLDQLGINELRSYAERVEVDNFEDMKKDELIQAIDKADYINFTFEIANKNKELV